jgi:hypothetical protein
VCSTREVRDRAKRERCAVSLAAALAATAHLLTCAVRDRFKSERSAISLAAVGGYSSLANARGEG